MASSLLEGSRAARADEEAHRLVEELLLVKMRLLGEKELHSHSQTDISPSSKNVPVSQEGPESAELLEARQRAADAEVQVQQLAEELRLLRAELSSSQEDTKAQAPLDVVAGGSWLSWRPFSERGFAGRSNAGASTRTDAVTIGAAAAAAIDVADPEKAQRVVEEAQAWASEIVALKSKLDARAGAIEKAQDMVKALEEELVETAKLND
eukprot:jgi/Mesen1/2354/ME000156S01499